MCREQKCVRNGFSGGVLWDIYFSFAVGQLVHCLVLCVTDSEEHVILRLVA